MVTNASPGSPCQKVDQEQAGEELDGDGQPHRDARPDAVPATIENPGDGKQNEQREVQLTVPQLADDRVIGDQEDDGRKD